MRNKGAIVGGAEAHRQAMINRSKPEEQQKQIKKMIGNKEKFYSPDEIYKMNKTKKHFFADQGGNER